MANKFYGAIGVSGGSDGYLDNIDGGSLLDIDGAFALSPSDVAASFYILDADKGGSQVIPTVMEPDTNAVAKKWLLLGIRATGCKLYEVDTTNAFEIVGSSGNWVLDNQYDGGTVTIQGENSGNSTMAVFDPAGAAELYHAGSKKLETASTGVDITGALDIGSSTPITAVLDEDEMTSDLANAVATQQSVKAYADAVATSNVIINGDMEIAQRGTSFVSPSSTDYTLDRWSWVFSGSQTVTVTQDTDVPALALADHLSNYSLKVDVTGNNPVLGSAAFGGIRYKIEGRDIKSLIGRVVTLSFSVKTDTTGVFCVSVINNTASRSYVTEYTVNSADTWERKSVTFTIESGQTYETEEGLGLDLTFCLGTGADYQDTADTWEAGFGLGTSSQESIFGTIGNYFNLAQVGLNLGPAAAPFVAPNFADELAKCQRYYEKSYDLTSAPGALVTAGMTYMAVSGTTLLATVPYRVSKRVQPTAVIRSPSNGATGNVYNYDTSGNVAISSVTEGENAMYVLINSVTDTHRFGFQWEAKAEL